jgi:hypothetical protein
VIPLDFPILNDVCLKQGMPTVPVPPAGRILHLLGKYIGFSDGVLSREDITSDVMPSLRMHVFSFNIIEAHIL